MHCILYEQNCSRGWTSVVFIEHSSTCLRFLLDGGTKYSAHGRCWEPFPAPPVPSGVYSLALVPTAPEGSPAPTGYWNMSALHPGLLLELRLVSAEKLGPVSELGLVSALKLGLV